MNWEHIAYGYSRKQLQWKSPVSEVFTPVCGRDKVFIPQLIRCHSLADLTYQLYRCIWNKCLPALNKSYQDGYWFVQQICLARSASTVHHNESRGINPGGRAKRGTDTVWPEVNCGSHGQFSVFLSGWSPFSSYFPSMPSHFTGCSHFTFPSSFFTHLFFFSCLLSPFLISFYELIFLGTPSTMAASMARYLLRLHFLPLPSPSSCLFRNTGSF